MKKPIISFKKILFYLLDKIIRKDDSYWMFSCHYIQINTFKDNQRALFEYIKKKPEIKKIIVYRGEVFKDNIEGAVNTEVVQHGTVRFFYLLTKSKVVFLSNSISLDYSFRFENGGFSLLKIKGRRRLIVNLWHSISLKSIFYTANQKVSEQLDRVVYRRKERSSYTGLISSSNIDSYAMAASFYPLSYDRMWITGLPRNDFLLMPEKDLPNYTKESLKQLQKRRNGKKLIVYAPTYRQVDAVKEAKYYQFNDSEVLALKKLLEQNNAILGYRPHYFENSKEYFNLSEYIDDELIIDLSVREIDDFAIIARELDVLITDYSSVFMDALYLDKPVLGFTYDLESYMSQQDGLLYDLKQIFPGPTYGNFDELLDGLEQLLVSGNNFDSSHVKTMFFKYIDDNNSERVVQEVSSRLN